MALTAPIPRTSPLLETDRDPRTGQERTTGFISDAWYEYLRQSHDRINAGPERLNQVTSKTAQTASIGTTSIVAAPSAGYYRVSVYARITTAASTSSSLIVTISWTDGGVSCTRACTAITGNTTANTPDPPFSVFLHSDAVLAISYATTYASVGGTPMAYRVDVALELLPT
jgi:hypothetical protein